MMRSFSSLLVLSFFLSGCLMPRLVQRRARELLPADCAKLEKPYLIWGSAAVGLGVLSGATGVGTLGPKSNTDGSPSRAQLGLAITSVSVGVAAAVSTYLATYYASRFSRCAAAP